MLLAFIVVHLHGHTQITDTVVTVDNNYNDSSYYDDEDDYDDEENTSSSDTLAAPVLREISADSIAALKKRPGFAYMAYIDSVFRHQKEMEMPEIEPSKPEEPGLLSSQLVRTIYWALAVGIVSWLIWTLLLGKGSPFARNKKLAPETEATNEEDDLIGKPIDDLLNKAIRDKDYRLATRYLYLQTLNLLAEKELVLLAPQKTNYQYQRELAGKPQATTFSKLTMQYEYVWFGGFSLSDQQFGQVHDGFKQFNKQLG